MAAPVNAFTGVNASTDAQKAALGSLIAQMGTAGAETFKAEQAVQQKVAEMGAAGVPANNPGIGNPSAASAVGPGQLTQQLAARAAAPGQLGAQQMGQAGTEFSKYAGLIGNANSNYMDAVKGAVPIVQAQANAEVQKIQAELAERRIARQAELNAQEEDRRWQEKTRGWQIQDRMLEEAAMKRELAGLEEGEGMPYSSERIRSSLGWSEDKVNKLTATDAYNDVYTEAMNRLKALGPTADRRQVDGMVLNILNSPNPGRGNIVYGDRPDIRRFIVNQLMGALGQAPERPERDTFNPNTGDKDTPPSRPDQTRTPASPDAGDRKANNAANPLLQIERGDRTKGATKTYSQIANMPTKQLYKIIEKGQAGSSDYILATAELRKRASR